MRVAAHTLETTTAPEALWVRWTGVADWPEWAEGVEAAALPGAFSEGGRITVTWRGKNRVLTLGPVEEGRRFQARLGVPLARLVFTGEVSPCPMGSRLSILLEASGPAAALWGWRLAGMQEGLAASLRNLARPR